METDFQKQFDEAVEKASGVFGDTLSKAATIIVSGGLSGYDLEQPAKLLMPTMQSWTRRIPRFKMSTGQSHQFKMITAVRLKGRKTAAEGERGRSASLTVTPYSFYQGTVTSGVFSVTRQAEKAAGSFDNALTKATMLALKTGLRNECAVILGGNVYPLGVTTVTFAENTTVKSLVLPLTNVPYYVYVRAMTCTAVQDALLQGGWLVPGAAYGECDMKGADVDLTDGYGLPSTVQTVTPATDSSFTVSWNPVPGAAGYGIFIGTTTGIANAHFVGATGQCSVVLRNIVATGTAASASRAYTDGYGSTVGNTVDETADTSADTQGYNGIWPTLWGVGSGGTITASGCVLSNCGAKLSAANGAGIPEIDDVLEKLYYNLLQTDDISIKIAPGDRRNINRAFGAGAANTILRINVPAGATSQANLEAGVWVNGYIHPITGRRLSIETDPNQPMGSILFVPESMPYPDTEIPSPTAMWMLDEWYMYDYAMTRPRREFENQCFGGVVVYTPLAYGILYNIFNG